MDLFMICAIIGILQTGQWMIMNTTAALVTSSWKSAQNWLNSLQQKATLHMLKSTQTMMVVTVVKSTATPLMNGSWFSRKRQPSSSMTYCGTMNCYKVVGTLQIGIRQNGIVRQAASWLKFSTSSIITSGSKNVDRYILTFGLQRSNMCCASKVSQTGSSRPAISRLPSKTSSKRSTISSLQKTLKTSSNILKQSSHSAANYAMPLCERLLMMQQTLILMMRLRSVFKPTHC